MKNRFSGSSFFVRLVLRAMKRFQFFKNKKQEALQVDVLFVNQLYHLSRILIIVFVATFLRL